MRYILPARRDLFMTFAKKLYENHVGPVELKKISRTRTPNQNKYLHVLFKIYGIETGHTLEESKTLLKRFCPFMIYKRNGHTFLRSTSDLDVDEMRKFIDWLRNFAGMDGIYLPTSEEYFRNWDEIESELEKNATFL